MDMFVTAFDTEVKEYIYINKRTITWLSVNVEELMVGFIMDGHVPQMAHAKFEDLDGLNNFMRGVKGEVYRVPQAVFTIKDIDK